MALVHKQIVYTHVLKAELAVGATVKSFLQLGVQVLSALFKRFYLSLGELALVSCAIKVFNHGIELRQLLIHYIVFCLLGVRYLAILLMTHDDTVIIIERDISEELLAVLGTEVLF